MFNFLRKTSLYLLAAPLLVTFLGIASNQVVLIANHDKFPVMLNQLKLQEIQDAKDAKPEEDAILPIFTKEQPAEVSDNVVMLDDVHCVMTSNTHLNFLADVFDLGNIYSIGDFLLMLGGWAFSFAPFLFVFDVARKLKGQN